MKLEEFSRMDASGQRSAVEEISRCALAPRNGQAHSIDARILAFEVRYEMTSQVMRERFATGELQDTADLARWLMLLQVRDRGR